MVLLQRKLYFLKDPEGSNIFRERRGAHHSFSISTHHYPCISLALLIKKSTSLIEVL